jgi:hypothetical protein
MKERYLPRFLKSPMTTTRQAPELTVGFMVQLEIIQKSSSSYAPNSFFTYMSAWPANGKPDDTGFFRNKDGIVNELKINTAFRKTGRLMFLRFEARNLTLIWQCDGEEQCKFNC